jgi:CDP-diacylglycerol--glycerol-3-phosphate 3-phosphatidyltransferase
VAALVQEDATYTLGSLTLSNEAAALLIFLAAALTDLLDGFLARRWNQITTLGMLLDPIADKLLISAALVSLVQTHRVAAWMAILIISREFAVSGLRAIAASEGYTIKASELGKTKMVTQVAAIALTLIAADYPFFATAADVTMWGAMIFALVSAADYVRNFWHKIDERIKERRRTELLQLERQRHRAAKKVRAAVRGARAR